MKVKTHSQASVQQQLKKRKGFAKGSIYTLFYYGGKKQFQKLYVEILNYAHDNYRCYNFYDLFAGSGIISLQASRINIFNEIGLNDLYTPVVNYHRVMQDDKKFTKMIKIINQVEQELYHTDDFNVYKTFLTEQLKEIKEKYRKRIQHRTVNAKEAAMFYIIRHYQFMGQGNICPYLHKASDYLYLEKLEESHNLYKNITITQRHYKKIFTEYCNDPTSLILLDPPYLQSTRVVKKAYEQEWDERDHRNLVKLLTEKQYLSKIIICGYTNPIYDNYFIRFNTEHNLRWWHCYKIEKRACASRKIKRFEHIWTNFPIDLNSNFTKLTQIY